VAARAHAVHLLGARDLAARLGRACRNALRGAKSGCTRGSTTCSRLPPWHASQPMPISTKLLAPKRDLSSRMPCPSAARRFVAGARRRAPDRDHLLRHGVAQRPFPTAARVDLEPPAPVARQQSIDDRALVAGRARPASSPHSASKYGTVL
jgi:hypothetical protein